LARIAGIALVLLLFSLNLTTTDGKINIILFYANIVGINHSVFHSTNRSATYTFISLANLDLGIETCFYNGMDDHVEIWLQLVFPIYLIFIATLLIMTSRYSTTIQRLTARRALPVLATLFLLSYTKVLLTVSSVLFFYTSITYLPSDHTTLVWSVDANVQLFGVKFTILFIACLILFLILIPFNIALLFTRSLSYFRMINYFKPLLDAYQGPYKIEFYYWPGLQLLIRAIFFGLSALDRDINLAISIILLGVMIWLHEKLSPFKNSFTNSMDFFSILNLIVIFLVSAFTASNSVIFNGLVALTMFQLICVIVFHITLLKKNSKIILKIVNTANTVKACFTTLLHLKSEKTQKNIELINVVPDVSYNYKEFQEPLIGVSK